MFDTLYIGTSGLLGNAQGLKIVSNNLANVNTPGFKGAQLRFGALFEQGGGVTAGHGEPQAAAGQGVTTLGAQLNFRPGSDQSTGNALDQSINGNGMFVVRRDGELRYTRAGDFSFNGKEVLVNGNGDHVQALSAGGELTDITLDALGSNPAKVTTTVSINNNLTSNVAVPPVDATVNGVPIVDLVGGNHTVNLSFKDLGGGAYTVTVTDGVTGGATLGTGTLRYSGGQPSVSNNAFTFQYSTAGVPPFTVKLDFSKTSNNPATTNLQMGSADGRGAGVRTAQTIGSDGFINVTYSNGEKGKGQRLALAQFVTEDDLVQDNGAAFSKTKTGAVSYGYAGTDAYGSLVSGHREGSNVDLAEEFSNLIVMQRGYQAASHVISTTNDMIQELFDMKGHR